MFCAGTSPMRSGFPGGGIFGGDGSFAVVHPAATAAVSRMAKTERIIPDRLLPGPAERQRKPARYYTHPGPPYNNRGFPGSVRSGEKWMRGCRGTGRWKKRAQTKKGLRPMDAATPLVSMVGMTGFEPATPWSRTRCSTRLSHIPTEIGMVPTALTCRQYVDHPHRDENPADHPLQQA